MDTTLPTTTSRPNRVLMALAAAWLILSLAIGSAVSGGDTAAEGAPTTVAAEAPQP